MTVGDNPKQTTVALKRILTETKADKVARIKEMVGYGKNGVTFNSLELEDFTLDLLANKPKYARDVIKWYEKGGKISIDDIGVWTYHDWKGNSVSYLDGYPDFKSAGMVQQEVLIGEFKRYDKDFLKADELAPNGPKADENTWHHHQDGTTMQEIDKILHKRFRHIGGMSSTKK